MPTDDPAGTHAPAAPAGPPDPAGPAVRAEDGDVVGTGDGDGRGDGDIDVDVAVVGAGPTGLALALQLAAFGVRCRLLDAGPEPAPHSRAMAIQPRTLEVLRPLGVSEDLVRRGNVGARLHVHAGGRVTTTKLFDTGLPDTAYPHLLFISQAETERALLDALARRGAGVERSTRLVGLDDEGARVVCRTRHADGTTRSWRARYVVGCDGASSAVRRLSGIPFVGGAYPQTFVLADLGVDGLEPLDGSDGRSPAPEPSDVHAYLTPWGPLLFFPLRRPAPRRLIAARPTAAAAAAGSARGPADVDLAELQSICDRATGAALRLRDPVWLSAFTIHHRMAGTYARGRVLLAGDAAHVHSPVGAQGMNTGIQDAINLGWKLALVVRGDAGEALLRTYDTERRPVGAFVVRTTDRAFVVATSAHPVATAVRTRVLPRLLPALVRWPLLRRTGFRAMSQLSIRYGGSCAVHPSGRSHRRRARRRGLQAGDRLPDGPVVRNGPVDGMTGRLHDVLAAPAFHLLLCGPADRWDSASVDALATRFAGLLHVHRVDRSPGPGVLHDPHGTLLRHLSAGRPTQLLVRPDGHVGLRAEHVDLSATAAYLRGLAAPGPAAGQRPDGAG